MKVEADLHCLFTFYGVYAIMMVVMNDAGNAGIY